MISRTTWLSFYLVNWMRRISNYAMRKLRLTKQFNTVVKNEELISLDDIQQVIKEIIEENKPALVARFGSNEAHCTAEAIGVKLGIKRKIDPNILHRMHINAGMFPETEAMAMRFAEISCEAAKQVDVLGYWHSFMQDYLVCNVCSSNVQLTNLGSLEPYYSKKPWSVALKGKKVLVIHPFKQTIEEQYKKREMLFENPDILPEFELNVIQAVQTIAGEQDARFRDWEEALNYMYNEAMKYDFDVAIIGCGAYGMPLAAMLKRSGKVAIHLGGATQLLFGIKGGRWDNHVLSQLYNEHWVRPMYEEIPKRARQVENACYW